MAIIIKLYIKCYWNTSLYFQPFCLHYFYFQNLHFLLCIQGWCPDIWTRKPMTDAPLLMLSSNQASSKTDQMVGIPKEWLGMWSDLRVSHLAPWPASGWMWGDRKLSVQRVRVINIFSEEPLLATHCLGWTKGKTRSFHIKWKKLVRKALRITTEVRGSSALVWATRSTIVY